MSIGDIITLVSIIVTVGSIVWGVYERSQAADARKEAQRFRRLLLKQQIAQQFTNVPEQALTLFRWVRDKKWIEAAEAALLLSAELASFDGIQDDLIGKREKEQLVTSLRVMSSLNQRLANGEESIEESGSNLLEACNVVLVSANALGTSLKIKAALGGDDGE